ncbi:hypothetical protein [Morganella morganii]|uniref:hypothetical protein n=1 Tax=Morganella morganii TaxID=582 RepID=UPI00141A09C7|nr:hypothetical protein [Morganella morganii]NIH18182.1 hypothetical protein [Morganella morganii]
MYATIKKSGHIVTLLLMVFTAAVTGVIYYNKNNPDITLECSATNNWVKLPGGYRLNDTMTLILGEGKKGRIHLSGIIENKETEYLLSRSILFTYQVVNGETVAMRNIRLVKGASDSFPDPLFNSMIYDLSETEKELHIQKLHNSYILSTPYSAYSMCVEYN